MKPLYIFVCIVAGLMLGYGLAEGTRDNVKPTKATPTTVVITHFRHETNIVWRIIATNSFETVSDTNGNKLSVMLIQQK